jgi:hypothetical protein
MWMGKRVYPVTFAKTQSVERAMELLAAREDGGWRSLTTSPLYRARNMAIRIWSACWTNACFPVVELGGEVVREFLRSPDPSAGMISKEPPPWPAYVIRVAKGILQVDAGRHALPIEGILVFRTPPATWLATQSPGTRAGLMDLLVGDAFGHEAGDPNEDHRRVARWLWRVVAAVECELRDGTRVIPAKGDPGEDPMRLPRVRSYEIRSMQ